MDVLAELGFEFEVGEGTGVKPPKTGVVNDSVTAGEAYPDGVDACSVANRSGVGEDPELKSPHPRIKKSPSDIHKSLVLFMIPTQLIQE
jgi:hypothetical protein